MKHLFNYTIHDKTISADDIFNALRRSGIVINGVIHWAVYREDLNVFSISSNYPRDHFAGIEQGITRRELGFDTDPNSRNDTILSFSNNPIIKEKTDELL